MRKKRFLDNGDGTVTDTVTGLMWQQRTAGPMTWEAAQRYCAQLELGGGGWRAPNEKEFKTFSDSFWASIKYAGPVSTTNNVSISDGIIYNNQSCDYYVRPVRGVLTQEK